MKSTISTCRSFINRLLSRRRLLVVFALLVVVAGAGAALAWRPQLTHFVTTELGLRGGSHEADDGHDPVANEDSQHPEAATSADGHDHSSTDGEESHDTAEVSSEYDHPHSEAETITLSTQAQANIGVQLTRVELQPFDRSLTLPGMVVERPGWSIMEVTAPMTGVITRMYCVQGEAIKPGQPLFELRLTHEELLQVQTEYLRTVEELDVIGREVARLEKVAADGAIAGKSFLERKYDQQRQEAMLRTLHQALLLHGLSEEHVATMKRTRTLLQSLTVFAPVEENTSSESAVPRVLQIRQLNVSQGKFVNAGDTLCELANHAELYIEGQAFEQDVPAIHEWLLLDVTSRSRSMRKEPTR